MVQITRLTKQVDFKTLLKVSLPATVLSGALGVILAFNGVGVWSLVWMAIFKSILTMNVFEKQSNHDILFSETIPPNPAHLLANGNFETLIEEAKSLYDYIVVDLAPTILVTDTLLISHLADATICAVRANHPDKKLIPFSVNLSKTNRLKNMVYVINGVKENRSYGYSFNYGYKYGYGDEDSSSKN